MLRAALRSNFGITAKLLWKLTSCGLELSAQHFSSGLLIGTPSKHHVQNHAWKTGEFHPSRPNEDVHRKHVVNLHCSLSAVICSHNMYLPCSIVCVLLCKSRGEKTASCCFEAVHTVGWSTVNGPGKGRRFLNSLAKLLLTCWWLDRLFLTCSLQVWISTDSSICPPVNLLILYNLQKYWNVLNTIQRHTVQ